MLSFFLTGATLQGLSQQESDALLKGLNDVSVSRTGFKSYPTLDLARDLQVKAMRWRRFQGGLVLLSAGQTTKLRSVPSDYPDKQEVSHRFTVYFTEDSE